MKLGGWVFVIAMALFLPWYGRFLGERANAREQAASPPVATAAGLQVMTSEQDAEGVTEADLTPAYAQSFAAYTAARSAELAKQHTSEPLPPLTSAGTIITIDGKRLAVARTMAEGQVIALTVLGFQGTSAIRVACVATDETPVQLTSPQCRQAIEQAYGLSLIQ